VAGAVVALLGVGQLGGNVPAAALVNRLGDRRAMIFSAALVGAAMVASYLATNVAVLAIATLAVGACGSTFGLARQSFVTIVVPTSMRAAVMATVGGSHRLGLLIGPFVGAAVIHATHQRAAFLVAVGAIIATVLVLLVVPEPAHAAAFAHRPRETVSAVQVWRRYGRLLGTLGVAVFAVGAVRAARPTVVPLWADHIGLDAQTTSLIFGIGSAIDVILFYPAGRLMDRYGRVFVAVPSMAVLGAAMALVPLTSGAVSLVAVALGMGVGNGLGAGIVMTLGADAAPKDATVQFLAQWRLMTDSGNASGPLIVAAVAAVAGLASGIAAAGALGLLAAAGLARWTPRYSPFATREMVRTASQ